MNPALPKQCWGVYNNNNNRGFKNVYFIATGSIPYCANCYFNDSTIDDTYYNSIDNCYYN